MIDETGKVCTKCLAMKPASEFYKNKDAPDGLRSDCKSCFNETRSNPPGTGTSGTVPEGSPIETVILSREHFPHVLWYSFTTGDGKFLDDIGRCPLCGGMNVLFRGILSSPLVKGIVQVDLCNDCTMHAATGDANFITIDGELFGVRKVGA